MTLTDHENFESGLLSLSGYQTLMIIVGVAQSIARVEFS